MSKKTNNKTKRLAFILKLNAWHHPRPRSTFMRFKLKERRVHTVVMLPVHPFRSASKRKSQIACDRQSAEQKSERDADDQGERGQKTEPVH